MSIHSEVIDLPHHGCIQRYTCLRNFPGLAPSSISCARSPTTTIPQPYSSQTSSPSSKSHSQAYHLLIQSLYAASNEPETPTSFMGSPSPPADSRQAFDPSRSIRLPAAVSIQSRESGDVSPISGGSANQVTLQASPFAKSWAHFLAGGYVPFSVCQFFLHKD
jgi:hypothetical protein